MRQVRLIHLLHTLTKCHSRGIYAVNIHSHLWGAVLFLVLLATNNFFVISRYASASWLDSATFSVFLSSAVFCLTASAVFHTVVCHSEGARNFKQAFGWQVLMIMCLLELAGPFKVQCPWLFRNRRYADHASFGIIPYTCLKALIVGSFFPALYYAFYCYPHLQIFYLSMICLSGLGTLCVSCMFLVCLSAFLQVRRILYYLQSTRNQLTVAHGQKSSSHWDCQLLYPSPMRSRSMVHILYELSLASIGSFCQVHYILVEHYYSKSMPLLYRICQYNLTWGFIQRESHTRTYFSWNFWLFLCLAPNLPFHGRSRRSCALRRMLDEYWTLARTKCRCLLGMT